MWNERIDYIIQKLSSSSGFLSLGLQFVKTERIPETELLGERYSLLFSNNNKRSIEVTYCPSSDGKDFFLVYITNYEIEKQFNLEDWLRQTNHLNLLEQFKLINRAGSFEDKVDSLAKHLNELLENDALNCIVKGDFWERVYFNWAGMR
jgi:hypothetical protein